MLITCISTWKNINYLQHVLKIIFFVTFLLRLSLRRGMTLTPFQWKRCCPNLENNQQSKLQFRYTDSKRDVYHPLNLKKEILNLKRTERKCEKSPKKIWKNLDLLILFWFFFRIQCKFFSPKGDVFRHRGRRQNF